MPFSLSDAHERLLLDSVVSAAGIFIMVLDSDGRITQANDVMCSLTGYDPAQLEGSLFHRKLIAPEESQHLARVFHSQISGQRHSQGENTLVTADGSRRLVLWSSSVVETEGAGVRLVYTGVDITGRTEAEEELEKRLEIEHLLTTVTLEVLSLPVSRMDSGIQSLLERVGRFADADRSYVFRYEHEGEKISNTHEWCRRGISPQREMLQGLARPEYSWWERRLREDGVVYLRHLDEIPSEAEAERELLEMQGVASLLAVEISSEGRPLGFIGFDAVRHAREWSSDDLRMLRMLAGVLGAALSRRDWQDAAADLRQRLEGGWSKVADSYRLLVAQLDPALAEHHARVRDICGRLLARGAAGHMDHTVVFDAALLHDMGKLLVSRERGEGYSDHPRKGYELLARIPGGNPVATLLVQHHERPDGSGFPLGLTGDDIHTGAILIQVADLVDRFLQQGRAASELPDLVRESFPSAPRRMLKACARLEERLLPR